MNSIVQFVSENLIMLYLLVFTVVLGFRAHIKSAHRTSHPINVWSKCDKWNSPNRSNTSHKKHRSWRLH
jgi:hypothetical protein